MSTTTKHLLSAVATVAFAIAATATTVTNAFAEAPAAPAAPAAPVTKTVKVEAPAGKTRAEVQAEYLEARKNGTLLETEADFDVAQTRKQVVKH
ncbi:DUF4148 domain-containing protein [Duganella sp. FT109W]|uniref:DUF4148 domain-containing protein n=1 Tax=Duganella margarita TaxID=2692170 RepID=A0A7X4H2H3_9BURK|nr:DUF4148 domain-containing protein [Duganella margarita]MYM74096.1 DUF4148 domain-containing protein [Duganella margarita]MYN42097.1 DUF4148 domain-containing protein [Duganella margarita]